MSATREPIWAALWALVIADPTIDGLFTTKGRLVRPIGEVPEDMMPALFLIQRSESQTRRGKGMPVARTLRGAFVMYLSQPDPTVDLPAQQINAALDAFDDLFNSPRTQVQTLGGLAEHVYIAEGETEYYEGLLDTKSAAVVPINILIP